MRPLVLALILTVKTSTVSAFSPLRLPVGTLETADLKQIRPLFMEAEIFTGSMSGGFHSRKKSTARESAVLVDWERRSELERRVEDGIHYEHFPEMSDSYFGTQVRRQSKSSKPSSARVTASGAVRGVFCGTKATKEEYERLRSANLEDRE